jgi:hypothetical protein
MGVPDAQNNGAHQRHRDKGNCDFAHSCKDRVFAKEAKEPTEKRTQCKMQKKSMLDGRNPFRPISAAHGIVALKIKLPLINKVHMHPIKFIFCLFAISIKAGCVSIGRKLDQEAEIECAKEKSLALR